MEKFESSIKTIPHPQTAVYGKVSDLNNLESLKGKIPADKGEITACDTDSVTVKAPMIGNISIRIIEREAPKCVKFEAENSPIPINLWIQIVGIDDNSCKIKVTAKAELNMFMRGLVKKPLQEGVEKIADMLSMISYQ